MDSQEIQRRYQISSEAFSAEQEKITLVDKWMRAYEKHLTTGESWSESFRFPELYGAVLRKYDNLIEYWPEMKVKGDGDSVIGLQSAYDYQVNLSNLGREKNRAGFDACAKGWGCVFVAPVRHEKEIKVDGKKIKRVFYDGLGAERVDPRDIIPAYSALVLHDHTGQASCPYLFRRRVFYAQTFKIKYADKMFNQDVVNNIVPSSYSGGFPDSKQSTVRESVEKETGEYVTVMEYWDQENDILIMYANGFENVIYESPNGIPYSHKQLPFHIYYDYRRHDSIFGEGEVELNMSYNLFREATLNLMIDNAKLELQPAYIISGDIQFNPEEYELQPGAIFNARGLAGGKLQDNIQPFRAGGLTSGTFQALETIEDSRVVVTGDDTRSLYADPGQLATQTLAKREALQKRVRGNIIRNSIETEYYLAKQITSYLKNELAKPYKDNETVNYRKIKVEGYEVIQDKKELKAEFKKTYGAYSSFYLNPLMAEDFDDTDIEVIPAKLDEEIKRDKTEKMMAFMNQIMTTAQLNPQAIEGLDIQEFLKAISKELSLDVHKIFPPLNPDKEMIDIINTEHNQMAMGIVPEIKPDEDSMDHFLKHIEFEQSSVFKKLSKSAHKALKSHKLLTLLNVQLQKANPGGVQPGGVEESAGVMPQRSVQGVDQTPGNQNEDSGGDISPQSFSARVRAGQDIGATATSSVDTRGL